MNTIKSQIAAVLVAVALLAGCGNPDDGPNAKRSGQEPNSDDPALGPGAMRAGQAPLGMSGSGSPDSGASPSPTNLPAPSLTDARMPNSPSQPDAGPTGSILDALLGTIDARLADMGPANAAPADAKPVINRSALIPNQVYFLTTKDQVAELTVAKGVFVGCMVEATVYNPYGASLSERFGTVDQVIPLRLATLADISRLKYPLGDFPSDYFAKMYGGSPEAADYAFKHCP